MKKSKVKSGDFFVSNRPIINRNGVQIIYTNKKYEVVEIDDTDETITTVLLKCEIGLWDFYISSEDLNKTYYFTSLKEERMAKLKSIL